MIINVEQLKQIGKDYEDKRAEYEAKVNRRFNEVVVRDLMRDYSCSDYCIIYDDWGNKD